MTTAAIDLSIILRRLAEHSARPRYAFMVLNLISEAADHVGSVGPYVCNGETPLPVRDWLSDAFAPMAERDHRRADLGKRVAAKMADDLPSDPTEASCMIAAEIRQRVRRSGKTNVSRAVSDLVRAGFVRRHYEGWITDHTNRGGRRLAVYTVDADALAALRRNSQLL